MTSIPRMKKSLVIESAYPDVGFIYIWMESRFVPIVQNFGEIEPYEEHYRLRVDPRYDFEEVRAYLAGFENTTPEDRASYDEPYEPQTLSASSPRALAAQLALLRSRLTASAVDEYVNNSAAEEAFMVVHGDYGRRFTDISDKVQDAYRKICRTAILGFLRQLWKSDLEDEQETTDENPPF